MKSFRLGSFAALLAITFSGTAFAHEGHTHGDEAPPPTVQTAPRATAASTLFELVAVAKGTELVIYLDQFATNSPVIGAAVDRPLAWGPLPPGYLPYPSFHGEAPCFLPNGQPYYTPGTEPCFPV